MPKGVPKVKTEKACDLCGEKFEASRKWAKYCSIKCRYVAWAIRHKEKLDRKKELTVDIASV
jgi:hypothetical protein